MNKSFMFALKILIFPLLFIVIYAATIRESEPQQIVLHPDMLLNISAHGDASVLVDEQQNVLHPVTVWGGDFAHKDLYYPLEIVIDLKGVYEISRISIFDTLGAAPLEILYGDPSDWSSLFVDSLNNYGKWNIHELDNHIKTQFILLKFSAPEAYVGEVLLYGKGSRDARPNPRRRAHAYPLFDDFVGVNGFIDDPMERLAPVANIIREYHPWQWDEGNESTDYQGFPNNKYAWSPSWVRDEHWAWDFDEFYGKLHSNGMQVLVDLKDAPLFMKAYNSQRVEEKPTPAGMSALDPKAYAARADYFFQFSARYGKQKVAPQQLKLAADQKPLSGLDLVDYIEDWNEQDRWWETRAEYFSPAEYTAMLSAVYDGHGGTMGAGAGAKTADPQMQVVMGGLAKLNLDYLKAMAFWARHHRADGSFPADVINLHHYCNSSGGQWTGFKTEGVSPEQDSLKEQLEAFVEWRDRYQPGKEIWLSEFGYDRHPLSPQRAPAIGEISPEEVQARWLMRAYLAASAAGIDKAFMFMLRDVSGESQGRFMTSGMTRERWNQHEPYTAWFYMSCLKNGLKGLQFERVIASGNPDVWIYKFQSPSDPHQAAYVLWCPSSQNKSVDYHLALPGLKAATLIEPQNNLRFGKQQRVKLRNGLDIKVTEKPVIVFLGSHAADFKKIPLSKKMLISGQNGHFLLDEQEIAADPAIGKGSAVKTAWEADKGKEKTTIDLDLGKIYRISDIWMYDGKGVGNLEIASATQADGPFRASLKLPLNRYNAWRRWDGITFETRYLRLSITGDASVNELVIYGW